MIDLTEWNDKRPVNPDKINRWKFFYHGFHGHSGNNNFFISKVDLQVIIQTLDQNNIIIVDLNKTIVCPDV